MYECLNCSSGLKFNIALQQLVCEHCNSQYDPYEFDVPFLSSLDGYAYVFMGEKEENKFVDATFEVSYS